MAALSGDLSRSMRYYYLLDSLSAKGIMMRAVVILIIIGLLFLALAVSVKEPDSARETAIKRQVLEVQAGRFQAMIDVDIEELEVILSNDLTYTHTSGQIETKGEFLTSLQSQEILYESIKPQEIKIRIYDNTAVVTSISAMRISVGEQQLSFSIRFIEVYQKGDANWQLVAWQSTRLPEL